MFSPRRKQGFTLIELLVVIAIIAILAAILFPVFAGAKERARATKCLSNLKQLAAAFTQYSTDFNGTYPGAGSMSGTYNANPKNWCGSYGRCARVVLNKGELWSYLRTPGVYVCPTDWGKPAEQIIYADVNPPVYAPKDFPLSYGMNYGLSRARADTAGFGRTSKLMLLIHEQRRGINDGIFVGDRDYAQDLPDRVHYDGTNLCYVDGHARGATYDQLLQERDAGYWECGK